jgi:hypothetical protein
LNAFTVYAFSFDKAAIFFFHNTEDDAHGNLLYPTLVNIRTFVG